MWRDDGIDIGMSPNCSYSRLQDLLIGVIKQAADDYEEHYEKIFYYKYLLRQDIGSRLWANFEKDVDRHTNSCHYLEDFINRPWITRQIRETVEENIQERIDRRLRRNGLSKFASDYKKPDDHDQKA